MLNETRFDNLATQTLAELLSALEPWEDEIETELSAGILSLEFADGTRYLVNSHRAARQIWMAAGTTAWHFSWQPQGEVWVAEKSQEELWATVNRVVGEKLGHSVSLSAH